MIYQVKNLNRFNDSRSQVFSYNNIEYGNTIIPTYIPLIDENSITNSKSYTISYKYNRLKQVKDADGNILSQNKYHYKNQ